MTITNIFDHVNKTYTSDERKQKAIELFNELTEWFDNKNVKKGNKHYVEVEDLRLEFDGENFNIYHQDDRVMALIIVERMGIHCNLYTPGNWVQKLRSCL